MYSKIKQNIEVNSQANYGLYLKYIKNMDITPVDE